MNSFRKLNVYIKAKELVKQVYTLLKKFPREEQYALCDQLRLSQIDVACDLGYISQDEFDKLEILIDEEAKMLTGLVLKRQPKVERPLNCSVASSKQ